MHAVSLRERSLGKVRAAIAQFLGIPIELTNHKFWAEFNSHSNPSGERVNVSTALRISTVWACVRLLSETISTLPLMLYRRQPEREVATKHPLYLILHDSPNADMTAVTFWEVIVASMLLWGNAYALILRAGGNVVALELLRPDTMRVRRLPDGSIEYRWRDLAGREHVNSDDDILHIPAFSIDGIMGLSPIGYAGTILGSAIAADRAAGTVFRTGLMLSGTFETPNSVKVGQRDEFKIRLDEYRGAINAGQSPLLEGGVTYKPIGINPNDAQLLETRGFSIEEICRWYRVPPFMVGHGEKSSAFPTSIEHQGIAFLQYSLRPWLKRIEQAVNKKLLGPTERLDLYTEFNFEALLRADSAGRAEFYAKMVMNGIYTRNEVREKENLAPKPGADDLTAQVNLAPLSSLGKLPPPPPAPPPPPPSALNISVGMPDAPDVTVHHSTPINVRTPDVRVTSPTINVAQPAISVAAAQAPNVDVHMPDVRVDSPVTVNVPEQNAPRVTIHQAAAEAPPAPAPVIVQAIPFAGVEFTYDDDGDVTGARLKT